MRLQEEIEEEEVQKARQARVWAWQTWLRDVD